jgi:peptidyl-prolyl cis-trans isomerase C
VTVSVNGTTVSTDGWPSPELAAVRELLRQRAVTCAILAEDECEEETISVAIERLLEQEVQTPSPTEEECRRYYQAHRNAFRSGDLVLARHILFQIAPGTPVAQVRARAEETLTELARHPERFAELARTLSNCPSGQHGGNLGQLGRGETVPEFERELFAPGPTGLVRRLVRSRYGFHIVAIDHRVCGRPFPFEAARPKIVERLREAVQEKALRQYIAILAGQSEVIGADLKATTTPLVQ